ncbi:hypothetical protein E1A91_D02G170800v1 [Gossypium mustelinum]|uniref:Uncharacterized protein n=2 Tax=Gossypium TaxID=3633 RepID=A0A5J5SID1_GOSBA|nr:hypothetical protein ES319_D02G164900v1 [Gossypium barbadense]KAB2041689.1 hypothetical protein ES319_D02G164900v1 [Gossypium barbadense]TYI93954.1 hypothetical protein E1A91_D02G170800v1 [Gossypium mustelinum]
MSAKIHNQTNSVRAFQSLRSKSRRNMRGQHGSRIEGSIKIHFQHSAFWRPPTFNPNKAIRAQMLLSFTRGLVLQCYSHRIHGLQSLLFLRKSGIRLQIF